jgi:hypothetical protein
MLLLYFWLALEGKPLAFLRDDNVIPLQAFAGSTESRPTDHMDASVFNSGVRVNGNFPNRLPSAKAGSLLSILASCTPVIRATSVSKCVTARRFGSFASRYVNARRNRANNSGSR